MSNSETTTAAALLLSVALTAVAADQPPKPITADDLSAVITTNPPIYVAPKSQQ